MVLFDDVPEEAGYYLFGYWSKKMDCFLGISDPFHVSLHCLWLFPAIFCIETSIAWKIHCQKSFMFGICWLYSIIVALQAFLLYMKKSLPLIDGLKMVHSLPAVYDFKRLVQCRVDFYYGGVSISHREFLELEKD